MFGIFVHHALILLVQSQHVLLCALFYVFKNFFPKRPLKTLLNIAAYIAACRLTLIGGKIRWLPWTHGTQPTHAMA